MRFQGDVNIDSKLILITGPGTVSMQLPGDYDAFSIKTNLSKNRYCKNIEYFANFQK